MIDDNNRDPTFTYTVPDTVKEVPSRREHACELCRCPGLAILVKDDDTFYEQLYDAFDVKQAFEYCYARPMEPVNRPAPLDGSYEGIKKNPSQTFARAFAEAETRLHRAQWVPLNID